MLERGPGGPIDRPGSRFTLRRWLWLIAFGLALDGLVIIAILGPVWAGVFTSYHRARWLRLLFFEWLFVGHAAALVLTPIGLIASVALGLRARRRGNRRFAIRAARASLICLGLLLGLGMTEVVCAWKMRGLARLLHLPTFSVEKVNLGPSSQLAGQALPDARPLQLSPSTPAPDGKIDIAIIGGSSAAGVPFQNRLSLDRIIAWQLGRAFAGKSVHAENLAVPGITLERAIGELGRLQSRPDLLIVYSGQNEFQSRFGWGRKVSHYRVEPKVSHLTLARLARGVSNTAEFLGRGIDRFGIEFGPPPRHEVDPADSPCCTPEEYAATLEDYRRRLDGLLGDCSAAGIMTMVVVPPSNDGAFDPNRSILAPDTSPAAQRMFMEDLKDVHRIASADPPRAIAGYRRLLDAQPGFAETHYRLAQLLEAAGSYDEASAEYIRARDLDGLPFRCQTPFLEVGREVGRRHNSIVIDGPRLLAMASPHGIVNDRLFHDAHHPSLNAYVILAREAVRQLKERRAFGWPESSPAPTFDMADCIPHFKLERALWIQVCQGSRLFYHATAMLPRDRTWRDSVWKRYGRAIELLEDGKSPEETGIPSLKIREELRAEVSPGSKWGG